MKYTILLLGAVLASSTIVNAQNTPWKLNGNSISSGKFIGTINNKDLIFKANGLEGFRLKATNNKLIVKGISVFQEKTVFNKNGIFKANLKIKSLEDLLAISDRLIGVNANGKVKVISSSTLSDLTISSNFTALGSINANNGITFSDGTVQTTAIDLTGGSNAVFTDLDVTSRLKIGTNSLYLGSDNGGIDNYVYTDAGALRINANEGQGTIQNTFINQDGGFVGIGTNTPSVPLHIIGKNGVPSDIQLGGSNTGYINMGVTTAAGSGGGGGGSSNQQFSTTATTSGSCRIDAYAAIIGIPGGGTPHTGGLTINGISNSDVTIGNPIDKASDLNVYGKTYLSDFLTIGTAINDPIYGARLNEPNSKAGQWYNTILKGGLMMSGSSNAIYFRKGRAGETPTNQVNGDIAICLEDRPNGDPQFSSCTNPILGLNWFNPYPSQAGGGNWQMFISSSAGTAGHVGLGTPYPTHRLTVNGTIGARRVIVETTDWCDYVFANDYQLMPLDEVESFIQKNNHLPEIPSEKDVIENGHDLAKTNKLLLKKVEELTLYMLQMNKRVAQLEHEKH